LVSPLWLRHDPQVLGSFATALFDDFIVDDLACLKLSQAGALDGRDVYKTSGAAALTVLWEVMKPYPFAALNHFTLPRIAGPS